MNRGTLISTGTMMSRVMQVSAGKGLVMLLLVVTLASQARGNTVQAASIVQEGGQIRLKAGTMERILRLSGGRLVTEHIAIDGQLLTAGEFGEVAFRLARAEPNRCPGTGRTGPVAGLDIEATEKGGTDALKLSGARGKSLEAVDSDVKWLEARSFSGQTWSNCFRHVTTSIVNTRPGVTQLIVRSRALDDAVLAGVSVSLFYEVYDNYPVIRKWFEIHNNSATWVRLDELTLDDIRLAPVFQNRTELTPGERGAGSSIVAFSNPERTRGVIVASEIPSALRRIERDGSSGYAPDYFEWILGPAESFVSEPVFTYAISGEVQRTASAESLPLDRAVESDFKGFLREHLGISPARLEIPAPQWATWSNFGPDVTGAIIRQQAEIAARCGFALFELDDGWQRGRLGIEPDSRKIPDMLETARYVRSLGLRLGLWVSSFRLPDEKDFRALPQAAVEPAIRREGGMAMGFAGPWSEYYANDLVFLHDYYGATYFKQDFTNIKFGDLGAGCNARTRKESLLRGLRGLLQSQATLRRLAPSVANEITHEIYWGTPGVPADLAALKHVALYHIPPNDYSGVGHWKQRVGGAGWESFDPSELRRELIQGCRNARERFYAHRGLPLECIEYYGAATVNWKGSLTPGVQDRQVASWLMGAPLLFSGDLASLTEENIARYRQRFGIVKRLEHEYGIYRCFQYSGVPAPTDTDWHWWGKLNPAGDGAVVVLRGSGGAGRRAINIPWVRAGGRYHVTALFAQQELGVFEGTQLSRGELILALPPFGQEILELRSAASPTPQGSQNK